MRPGTHFLLASVLLLTACGGVITPQPAADAPAADAPTATPSSSLRTTATPPILPPANTATPTVSPTPIVYVVQSGDTLLGIALDYGVDVDRLMAVNGIDNPLLLRVGQALIIPTGEEETAGQPTGLLVPTPTPIPFGIRGVAFYETPVSSLWCLGEVVNTTANTLTNVQVRVLLFDPNGELAAAADVFADAELIPPGERSPFRVLFTNPPAAWASPQVTVIRGQEAGELAAAYVPISVMEGGGQMAGPQFQVSGVLRNDSPEQAAGSISVIVTTYDGEGLVTGARQENLGLESPLAPGATAPFAMLLTLHGDAPADLHIIALGRTE